MKCSRVEVSWDGEKLHAARNNYQHFLILQQLRQKLMISRFSVTSRHEVYRFSSKHNEKNVILLLTRHATVTSLIITSVPAEKEKKNTASWAVFRVCPWCERHYSWGNLLNISAHELNIPVITPLWCCLNRAIPIFSTGPKPKAA